MSLEARAGVVATSTKSNGFLKPVRFSRVPIAIAGNQMQFSDGVILQQ